MRKLISVLLVLLWMLMIFSFSNATGEESNSLSDKVVDKIVLIFTGNSKNSDKIKIKFSFVVRKLAHFFVYFMLGILVMNSVYVLGLNKYTIIYASIICILYAITDEFHQTFISGRSGQIRDVLLDSSASLIANYLFMKFMVLRYYEKNSN